VAQGCTKNCRGKISKIIGRFKVRTMAYVSHLCPDINTSDHEISDCLANCCDEYTRDHLDKNTFNTYSTTLQRFAALKTQSEGMRLECRDLARGFTGINEKVLEVSQDLNAFKRDSKYKDALQDTEVAAYLTSLSEKWDDFGQRMKWDIYPLGEASLWRMLRQSRAKEDATRAEYTCLEARRSLSGTSSIGTRV